MATPWLTSNDLIASIQRKIAFPISQDTFTNDDILAFANEEMAIAQVPSVLQFHQEYFVVNKVVPLQSNVSNYPIPERAIGMKLRGTFFQDTSGNLFDMTRITSNDRAFFQSAVGANRAVHKFYVEGNDIVLVPSVSENPSGSILMVYFLRPNQLVTNDRAATIQSFFQTITINNTTIAPNDTVTINGVVFTAVASGATGTQFNIGATSVITATNLATAINSNGVVTANNGNPSTAIITCTFSDKSLVFSTSNTAGFAIPTTTLGFVCDQVPTNIASGTLIDILQTKAGHRTLGMDVLVPNNAVSATTILLNVSDIPSTLVIGDYFCSANECIIPQIPSDLHNGLAERTSARILAAIGDQQGLQTSSTKIQEIEKSQGMLLDNRVEGNPQKVLPRNSPLRYGKIGTQRRI